MEKQKIQDLINWLSEQQNKSLLLYSQSLKNGERELAYQFTGEHIAYALASDKLQELLTSPPLNEQPNPC